MKEIAEEYGGMLSMALTGVVLVEFFYGIVHWIA